MGRTVLGPAYMVKVFKSLQIHSSACIPSAVGQLLLSRPAFISASASASHHKGTDSEVEVPRGSHPRAAGRWVQEDDYIDVSPADSPLPGGGGSGPGGNGVAPLAADMEDPVYETPPERFWSLGDLFEVPPPRHRYRQASMCDAVQLTELQVAGAREHTVFMPLEDLVFGATAYSELSYMGQISGETNSRGAPVLCCARSWISLVA